ncbi:OmpA family protein [Povalibacter sp.]|uniref:OmpA family protein n=1 Tax=Povalibacter sp. TaxID=1962978 RepID=UPI002F42D1C7
MKQVALFCALAAPVAAVAADNVGHWYVTPQIGGISVDNDRPVQDKDWLYGLGIGKHVSDALSIEMNLNGSQIGGGPGRSDLSLYGGSLDLLRVFNRAGKVSPYLSAGLGVVQNERSPGSNATDFMTQAGVGLLINTWESADGSSSFALRPDLKARWDDAGSAGHLVDYIGTLGFQYSFGAPKARAAEPTPLPPPAPTPPPPPPAPADTDKDGVTDDIDRCPGTPAGIAVDTVGCPLKGSITLEGVTFETNSAQLTSDSRTVLNGVATGLKKYPRLKIELQGHTDSSGSDRYNLTLSRQRADSVRTHLLEQGVATSQLTAKGYGEAQPVADNTTADGRATNRRVVMQVLDNPGEVKVEGAVR